MTTRQSRIDRFGRSQRYYNTSDGIFPSVTTVLGATFPKPALVNWAAKLEREFVIRNAVRIYEIATWTPPSLPVSFFESTLRSEFPTTMKGAPIYAHSGTLKDAGDSGTAAHDMIEAHGKALMGAQDTLVDVQIDSGASYAAEAFRKWAKDVDYRPSGLEKFVWSKSHGFAGAYDARGLVRGKETMCDWKTGKDVYREAHIQLSAYSAAAVERGEPEPEQLLILKLPKSESEKLKEVIVADPAAEFNVFLKALALYKALNPSEDGIGS